MHTITFTSNSPPGLWRAAGRKPAWLTAAAAIAVLAGCGGSAHSRPASTPTAGAESAVGYAACMRSHGVPTFPDPGRNGRLSLGSGIDPSSPQFQAAQKLCHGLLPTGGSSLATQSAGGTLSLAKQAQLLVFSRCMRAHGVPTFPDPTSQGIALPPSVDPQSPQFQAATMACRRLAPSLGQGGSQSVQSSGGGQ